MNFYIIKLERQIVPKNKHVLILGDSNTECAINDNIFNKGINFSTSAESYFYTYLKLKKVTNDNSKIDTLLLAFAPHNVFENGRLLNKSQIQYKIPMFLPLMDFKDFIFLLNKEPKVVLSTILKFPVNFFSNTIKTLNNKKIVDYGGFLNLERNALKEVQLKLIKGEELPPYLKIIPQNFKISGSEMIYFNKIIKLCEKLNIKLYLINTPKRKEILDYKKYGNKQFYDFYFNKYKNIDFLDFSGLNLPTDNYGDFVHLNDKGSRNFTFFLEKKGLIQLSKTYNIKYSYKFNKPEK